MSSYPEGSQFFLTLQFGRREAWRQVEGVPVSTIDLTSALYDFELVYEVAALRSLEEYQGYGFENFFVVGRRRPLDRAYQLRVATVSYGSPLSFLAEIPWPVVAAGTIWPLYKAIELVYTVDARLRVARKELLVREAQAEIALQQANETLAQLKARQEQQEMRLNSAEIIELPPPADL